MHPAVWNRKSGVQLLPLSWLRRRISLPRTQRLVLMSLSLSSGKIIYYLCRPKWVYTTFHVIKINPFTHPFSLPLTDWAMKSTRAKTHTVLDGWNNLICIYSMRINHWKSLSAVNTMCMANLLLIWKVFPERVRMAYGRLVIVYSHTARNSIQFNSFQLFTFIYDITAIGGLHSRSVSIVNNKRHNGFGNNNRLNVIQRRSTWAIVNKNALREWENPLYFLSIRSPSRLLSPSTGLAQDLPESQGHRTSDRKDLRGHGAGGGRHRRQIGSILCAGTDQCPIADANWVQDPSTELEQNIHIVGSHNAHDW